MVLVLAIKDVLTGGSKSILNPKYRYQLLVTLAIQLFSFAHGIATGWTSPTLHKLQSAAETPTTFTISVEQASWIGSLYGLGSLAGNILWGIVLNRIGRKWSMYLLALPHMCSWVLIFFSKTYVYLYIARFLTGVSGGANNVVIPIFISEIADQNIRGALNSMAMVFLSIGIMIGYVLSSHVDYYLNPCLVLVLPVLYLILIVRFPETPQYLLRLQDVDQARKSFHFYKNLPKPHGTETEDGGKGQIEENAEFLELKNDFEHRNGSTEKLMVKDFVNRDALMGFCTAFMLIFLYQFSGSYPFLNYMSDVFAHAGTDINPNTCTIIMGATQILGTCCATLLVDHFGRKVMMLISTGGLALCLFAFGMFMEFTTVDAKLHFNWVPLVIMTGAMFISCGIIGLVFTIIVEVIPTKIRDIGNSIDMAMMSVLSFVSLKIFPAFLHDYGLGTLMFSCSGVCVISWFYLLKFQEETNGKSMDK